MPRDIINKTPKTDWKPGDVCYIYAPWAEFIMDAKVEAVHPADQTIDISSRAVDHEEGVPFCAVFPTFDAGMAALSEANAKRRKEYEGRITSVPELLQFALDEKVSASNAEYYTDGQARAAFVARAKDILGIDLKD